MLDDRLHIAVHNERYALRLAACGEHPAALAFLAEGGTVTRTGAIAVMNTNRRNRGANALPALAYTFFNRGVDRCVNGRLCLKIAFWNENGRGELRFSRGVIKGRLGDKKIAVAKADFADSDGLVIHNDAFLSK